MPVTVSINALAALGIRETPHFSGQFNAHLQHLKEGKIKVLEDFQNHATLDACACGAITSGCTWCTKSTQHGIPTSALLSSPHDGYAKGCQQRVAVCRAPCQTSEPS